MIVSEQALQPLLRAVEKPARYVGQELNSIAKDWDGLDVTVALAYPDLYELGMSNLGLAILYDRVNRRAEFAAERVYAPWPDMAAQLRAAGVPLYSLETRHALADFDVLGFSLQHELNYTNVLTMLDLAGLPVLARERTAAHPLVIAGGSCALNPEPLADFLDVAVLGEGEDVLLELLDAVGAWKRARKRAGGRQAAEGRADLLRRLAQIEGVYVPSLYAPEYAADGTLAALRPTAPGVPARVRRRIVAELGPAPTAPVLPHIQAVHDRAMVEIQRGCSRGCRFCQAGMIYRPIRERPVAEVLDAIDAVVAATGYEEVGLVSLSSSDHSGIAEIVAQAMARHAEDGLAISLPSLRIDSFSVRLAEMIQSNRKTGFTFAPEAGSQRLRDAINKGVTEDDLLATAEAAFASGWNRIKLYFMLGLPTETDDDVLEMARLIRAIARLGRQVRRRHVDVSVSVSTLVPKPHTPFQWAPLVARDDLERRQAILRDQTRVSGVQLSWSEWDATLLEAVFSRGDRRLGAVIQRAWQMGAQFDAWREHFQPALWWQAMAAEGLSPAFYAERVRPADEPLPWDVVDVGVERAFLQREAERARVGDLSPDCRETCHGCGILAAYADERAAAPARAWGCPA